MVVQNGQVSLYANPVYNGVQIVEAGNHNELIEKAGVYKDLVQAQLLDAAEEGGMCQRLRY